MVSIVLADDHPVYLLGLRSFVESLPSHEILTAAVNGQEALNSIIKDAPSIAILDIDMPEKSGLEVAAEVSKLGLATHIILLTFFLNEENYYQALRIGVRGLLTKDNALKEIETCIEKVSQGLTYYSKHCFDQLDANNTKIEDYLSSNPDLDILSPTEQKVLKLVSDNLTNKEIATQMFKSEKTIKNHRYNICQKLNLTGSNGLLEFALRYKHLID